MKLSVITVNFRSQKLISDCLKSINQNLYPSLIQNMEVIISNNDEESFILEEKFPFNIQIINNKANLGFAKANNEAAKKSQGEILFFLNPDTVVPNEKIIKILEEFNKDIRLGVAAPVLIDKSGNRPQPWTCGKKTTLAGILFRNTFFAPWNSKKERLVDWVSGAALMTRKNIFDQVGGFDENFFMYFEDQDLCLRIKSLGFENKLFPWSKIIHLDGKSWTSNKSQKQAFYVSQDYFFKKHAHPSSTKLLKIIRAVTKGL